MKKSKDIRKLFICTKATIFEAIDLINKNKEKIALIVENNDELMGTITDGDIRRAILGRKDLKTPAKDIMNKDFFSVEVGTSHSFVKKVMLERGINFIPVIDKKNRLVDLLCFDQLENPKSSEVRVIIMAGGKGSRLRPYTNNCPKPMVKVCGKPMLELILEKCISLGFSRFYFSVNYLKEQIIQYFGNGKNWGIDIQYLIERKPLGTAGSLSLFNDFNDEPVLVMNGDVLTTFDFRKVIDFHKKNHLNATLSVREELINFPYGVVETDGIKLKSFKEKPIIKKLVNAGVYVLSKELLFSLEKNKFIDMPDFLDNLNQNDGKVGAFPLHEYWIDIGRPETLEKAQYEWETIDINA